MWLELPQPDLRVHSPRLQRPAQPSIASSGAGQCPPTCVCPIPPVIRHILCAGGPASPRTYAPRGKIVTPDTAQQLAGVGARSADPAPLLPPYLTCRVKGHCRRWPWPGRQPRRGAALRVQGARASLSSCLEEVGAAGSPPCSGSCLHRSCANELS
jgi:hypothetical protein